MKREGTQGVLWGVSWALIITGMARRALLRRWCLFKDLNEVERVNSTDYEAR